MTIVNKIRDKYIKYIQKRNFKKEEKEYKRFFQNTTSIQSVDELDLFSDDQFNEQHELDSRNHLYSKLLSSYVTEYALNQKKKRLKKWQFYNIMLISFIVFLLLIVAMSVVVFVFFNEKQYAVIVSFATSLIGIFSTLAIMPQIIAKYLFNPHEDEIISKLVTDMQSHDNHSKEIISTRENIKP